MARMFPATPPASLNAGELEVWPYLEKLPADWTVINGYRFKSMEGRTERIREADFVVVTPDRGIIALEVKAGRMRFTGNQWRQNEHESDAEEQGRRCAHAIGKLLDGLGHGRVPARFALVFPDTPRFTLPSHLNASQGIFKQSYIDMPAALRDVLRSAAPERGPAGSCAVDPQAMVDFLAPDLDVDDADLLAAADEYLNTLTLAQVPATGRQIEAIRKVRQKTRICVEGPAGSGKTLIAVQVAREVAHEVAHEGGRVLLLSPSGQLRDELLSTKLDRTRRSVPQNVSINDQASLVEWTAFELKKAGLAEKVSRTPEKRASQTDVALWLLEAASVLPENLLYDAVIVDEAQDINHDVLEALEALAKDVDGRGPRVVLFADARQRLVDGELWEAPAGYREQSLDQNLRNTADVAHLAANALGLDVADDVATGGLPPTLVEIPATDKASGLVEAATVRAVEGLIARGIAPADIAVLTAGRRVDTVTAALRAANIATSRTGRDESKKPVLMATTARDVKGRECSVAVVVFGPQPFDDPEAAEHETRLFRSAAYVALSRARGHVVVIATPDQLDVIDPDRRFRAPAGPSVTLDASGAGALAGDVTLEAVADGDTLIGGTKAD